MKNIIFFLASPLTIVMKNRELMAQLVKRNLFIRYKGTFLGVAWNVLQPMFLFFAYSFAFGVVFRSRWSSTNVSAENAEALYAVIMFCGMTVYNIFSETISASPYIFVNNPNYIKKVIFPLEILPVSQVLTSIINVLFWFVILLVGTYAVTKNIPLTMLFLPVVLVPYILMMLGFSFFLSSIGVYFRDLSQICAIIAQVGFLVTPICYSIELIPEKYNAIINLNVIAWYVEEVRKVFVYGMLPDFQVLGKMFLVAIVVFYTGYACLRYLKKGFADVI